MAGNATQSAARPPVACGEWRGDSLRLAVRVQPRASAVQVGAVADGRLQLRVTAPPADGRANDQARRLLAGLFGVGPSRVELAGGERHRNKLFVIRAPARVPAELLAR